MNSRRRWWCGGVVVVVVWVQDDTTPPYRNIDNITSILNALEWPRECGISLYLLQHLSLIDVHRFVHWLFVIIVCA
jgi:hypothetical protein